MKVLLASPRGFCAGVNMAIESLELALEAFGAPIYVYHEIVHNQYVVSHFRERGVTFLDDINDAPVGATLLFSAHGVSPEIRRVARERELTAIDATCPLVTKVHLEAIKYAKQGYTILLIGHHGHDEVIGTMGEAPEQIILVEDEEDIDRLAGLDPANVAFLTQTTLSVDDTRQIIDTIRERYPEVKAPTKEDICYATQNRQEAVKAIAAKVDLLLVVGGANSSNSLRLVEVARQNGVRAYRIDRASEIEPAWLEGARAAAITAGASTPEHLVQEVADVFRSLGVERVEEFQTVPENVVFPLPRQLEQVNSQG
jgi:4-hydroxy-3-methylbut-2-en-1-yl diphosphate reductase